MSNEIGNVPCRAVGCDGFSLDKLELEAANASAARRSTSREAHVGDPPGLGRKKSGWTTSRFINLISRPPPSPSRGSLIVITLVGFSAFGAIRLLRRSLGGIVRGGVVIIIA